MVLVASLYELSRPSSPSGLLHGFVIWRGNGARRAQTFLQQQCVVALEQLFYNITLRGRVLRALLLNPVQ